jgi:Raf kinase inhibitor-like YbhB/YbcL family protein
MKRNSMLLLPLAALVLLGASSPDEPSDVSTKPETAELTLTSKDFGADAPIPVEHTCDGPDRSPGLEWNGVPKETKAFAIIAEDPDAPKGTFLHWIVWNIPDAARAFDGGVPIKAKLGDGTIQGKNDFDRVGYAGPCPPKGSTHKYVFRILALGDRLEATEDTPTDEVLKAAKKAAIADAKLTGSYERQ